MQLSHFILPITIALGACAPQHNLELIDKKLSERLHETKPQPAVQGVAARLEDSFKANLKNAVLQNQRFLAAQAAEKAAFAQLDVAKSNTRPQISSNATGGRLFEGSPINAQTNGVAADIMITQLVYDGGASLAAIDSATASALSARAAAQETGNAVALEAVRAWGDVWVAQQQLSAITSRSNAIQTLFNQIEQMTSSGMIDTATRDGAHLTLLDIRMEETNLRSAKAEAESRFQRYFNIIPARGLKQPMLLADEEVVKKAGSDISQVPSLRRAAADLVSAEANVSQARAQLKPSVNLNTGVTSPMKATDSTDTRIGLQLRYTFSDGGRRKSQLAAAIAHQESMKAQLADAQTEAKATLHSTLAKLTALAEAAKINEEKLSTAIAEAAAAESQIALGQATLNQLIDAEIKQYRAYEQQLKTEAGRVLVQATLLAGTGDLIKIIDVAR